MGNTSKILALSFILLILTSGLSLLMVKPVNAETIPKPSVPEFTLKYVDDSYYVPASNTTTIDPFTGNKTVIVQAGYYVENKSVAVSIKNLPFTPYKDSSGHYVDLYYDIRWMGHWGNNWWDYNSTFRMLLNSYSGFDNNGLPLPNSDFKVVSFPMGVDISGHTQILGNVSANGKIDFQVQAFIGYYTQKMYPSVPGFRDSYYNVFNGESSGWSSSQTISIPDGSVSVSTSPNQTSTPTVPEFPSWMILFLSSMMILVAGLSVLVKKSAPRNHCLVQKLGRNSLYF